MWYAECGKVGAELLVTCEPGCCDCVESVLSGGVSWLEVAGAEVADSGVDVVNVAGLIRY